MKSAEFNMRGAEYRLNSREREREGGYWVDLFLPEAVLIGSFQLLFIYVYSFQHLQKQKVHWALATRQSPLTTEYKTLTEWLAAG